MAFDLFGGGGVKPIQRGATTLNISTASVDVTIAAVDPDKTVVISAWRTSWVTSASGTLAIGATVVLIDSTTIRVARNTGTMVNSITVEWQVVEFE